MRHVPEEQRRQKAGEFLGSVNGVVAVAREEPATSNELSEKSLKVLVKAALEPGIRLLAIYKSLGLHPAEGKQAVEDLLARGYIRLHRLVRKGRGGQPQVIEVLSAGVSELKKRGITLAEKKVKRGGFLHDVYAREIEKWAKKSLERYEDEGNDAKDGEKPFEGRPGRTDNSARSGTAYVSFERTLGNKAFDVVIEGRNGKLTGVEICLSGSAEWNASQALKAASVKGVSEVIMAFDRKGFLQAVEKKLGEKDGLNLYRRKIQCRMFSEFVFENA